MLHSLFPSLVYQEQALARNSVLLRELLGESYKIAQIDKAGRTWSQKNYPGGYTSYGSMAQLHRFSPYFLELSKILQKHAGRFAAKLEMDIRPKDLRLVSLWVNIMGPGTQHSMHIHPLSSISGTFYVKLEKGASGLKLEDPRMVNFMASPPRKANAKSQNQRFVELKPKVGQLILFESWMRHEVPQNLTRHDRVSISFNFDW